MNAVIRVLAGTLFLLTGMSAEAVQFVIVTELKGTCFVREGEGAQQHKVEQREKLRAGQQLLCERRAYLKVKFETTDAVAKYSPQNWFSIPNVVVTMPPGDGRHRAGREASLLSDPRQPPKIPQ